MPEWKIPFAVSPKELYAMQSTDTRIGGFGPWYGGCVLLALTLGIFGWRSRSWAHNRAFVTVMISLVLLIGINPEAWWARYVPFAWLLPIAAWLWGRAQRLQKLSAMLLAAIVVNLAMSITPVILHTLRQDDRLEAALRELRERKSVVLVRYHNMYSNRVRLAEAGITVRAVAALDHCEKEAVLPASDTSYCMP